MARFTKRYWMVATLALALIGGVAPAATLHAQENAQSAPPRSNQSAQQSDSSGESRGEQRAEKEENDLVRHSPAVKFVARATGLSVDQAYWLCILLNFAIVFIGIAVVLRKKLPGYFTGRTSSIQKGIAEARKASEEARQRLSDVEGRLSRLDSEIATMRREAEQNARTEEQRILAAGEEERRRIVASAEQEIETTANAARRELKSYVAELAIELAEKKIRVSKETDAALVRSFTAQMGKDGN